MEEEKKVGSSENKYSNEDILEIYEKYHDPEII